jgi:hypothetical protein
MQVAMTAIRLIPLPVHAALRLATGLVTMAAPFVFGLTPAAAVVAVLVGAVVAGIALSATPDERGRTSLPISTLHAFDYGAALGLLGAAAVLGLAGDGAAFVVLAAIAAVQLIGNLTTRYSAR